jgi:Lrp/AsnC family leucine-responsive transcriptional regulator
MATRTRELDKIDRKILRILQAEGRISFTELGERVGLSTTPCTERVRRLEREGVITGYHAHLDPAAVKASLLVFVEISLAYKSGDIFEEFRRAALKLPNVLECHLVSGDFDYLLKARISEMASYRKLLGSTLLTLPHVRESKLHRDGRSEGNAEPADSGLRRSRLGSEPALRDPTPVGSAGSDPRSGSDPVMSTVSAAADASASAVPAACRPVRLLRFHLLLLLLLLRLRPCGSLPG